MKATRIAVVKIGGSVFTGWRAYRRVAAWMGRRVCAEPGKRIVAVVSAELGTTDALLERARSVVADPDPSTLDLLWSTGEAHSAATLALHLQAQGVRVAAANVHQTGLEAADVPDAETAVRPLRLLALIDTVDVVVVPGFLARGAGDAVVSLGRGGSDLTAVLLAAGLRAERCELIKDVPGYFTSDPKRDPDAQPLPLVSYARAIEMADAGCALVQRQALVTAKRRAVPLVIRALHCEEKSVVR